MRNLARAAVRAVGSGRFLTFWSIGVSLPLSLSVMAPVGDGIEPQAALPAMVVTWLCFGAALVGVATLERHGRSRPQRAAIVIAGIALCATLRPALQDGWLHLSALPTPSADQLPYRIATNIVVWAMVLSIIAVLESSLRSLRRTNALLRSVAQELARAQHGAQAFATAARKLLDQARSALAAAILDLEPTSAGVRRLGAEQVREWSHRLVALAEAKGAGTPGGTDGDPIDDGVPAPHNPRRQLPFRLPPPGIVALVYAACLLPYAARTQTSLDLLVGITALAVGGALADLLPRRRAIVRVPHGASSLFVMLSCVVGFTLAALAVAQGVPPFVAAVSAIAYIGFALAAGSCAGVLHRLRCDQRRLSSAVAHAQRLARADTRPVREGLRAAAELLHADAQGACVMFALSHPAPGPEEVRRLQDDLAAVVGRLPDAFVGAHDPGAPASLTALFDTWAHVIDLVVDIDDDAREALHVSPWVSRDCYEVIAEGLLNSAKHASERRAEVSLRRVTTGAGPRLRVRVSSPGTAAPAARLRTSSRMHELGARLLRSPDEIALEAGFALTADTAVVSAEHRGWPHVSPP